MIIPTKHEFVCADDPGASMDVHVVHPDQVCFDCLDSDGEMVIIFMRDREQVMMLRDMLTVWLSRP